MNAPEKELAVEIAEKCYKGVVRGDRLCDTWNLNGLLRTRLLRVFGQLSMSTCGQLRNM